MLLRSAESGSGRFRGWRSRCPFTAGLLTVLGGVEILLVPVIGAGVVVHTGFAGQFGLLLGAVLIGLGLLFWMLPAYRAYTALFAIVTSLAAFLAANLGGFLVGSLLVLVGAAAGAAWTPPSEHEPSRRQR